MPGNDKYRSATPLTVILTLISFSVGADGGKVCDWDLNLGCIVMWGARGCDYSMSQQEAQEEGRGTVFSEC